MALVHGTRVAFLLLPEMSSDQIKTFENLGFQILEVNGQKRLSWSNMRRFNIETGKQINETGWYTYGARCFDTSQWEFNLITSTDESESGFRFYYSREHMDPEEAIPIRWDVV